MMEYHLKKKKEEMESLMTRFTLTNTEHQHLMNENIRLVAQIRKRKKEEVKKIKTEQRSKFKKKVKRLKKTIMHQSKLGQEGETILRNSVLDKHFEQYSVVDDTVISLDQKQESNFFSKIKESMMIFVPSKKPRSKSPKASVKSKSRSQKKKSSRHLSPSSKSRNKFQNKKLESSSKKRSDRSVGILHDDESQIIGGKNFRRDEVSPFMKINMKSRVNNFSDVSEDEIKSGSPSTSLKRHLSPPKKGNSKRPLGSKKKIGSRRFSPEKLSKGKTLHPSNHQLMKLI